MRALIIAFVLTGTMLIAPGLLGLLVAARAVWPQPLPFALLHPVPLPLLHPVGPGGIDAGLRPGEGVKP